MSDKAEVTVTVTVAVPCYNGAAFVGGTIESLLAQSRPADEILVIDDGSTDDSVAIVSGYAQQYPVRLIQHVQNRGLAVARNTALAAAQSEILAFIDVDAQADPDWLGHLLTGYDHPYYEEIGGVGGAGIEVRGNALADRWRHRHASQHHGMQPKERVDFLYGLNMSFRRTALYAVGGFSTALRTNAEDMDVGYRLSAAGYRLVYRPQARVYHQRTDDLTSLRKTIYNWYFWAWIVKRQNRRRPLTLALGTMRRLITDAWQDLRQERDGELARLSVELSLTKLRALLAAARSDCMRAPAGDKIGVEIK